MFGEFKMRAEAQAHVDQINQALALVRRSLDWDRALRRLDGKARGLSRRVGEGANTETRAGQDRRAAGGA